MQVSHVSDHITHAVIGGTEPINLTISDSPEFFQILSSTLYTDQALAVVRENLCNAWDAQIEAGTTHIPLEITLTDECFSVRDHGMGIPRDRMGEIYGTYGGSTKRNNGTVTGGFGLGCKSPFALVDHFEVTSWNQGTKTIYRLSKSSAEVGGRPAIIPVVSLPTQESGLEVKVELPSVADRFRFKSLIMQIVSNGEMNATLNGVPLDKLPFSEATEGFVMAPRQLLHCGNNQIMVRYGHVLYPVEHHLAYGPQYQEITNFLRRISNRDFSIVLIAKPHSLTVTPSREALSMQDKTVESLTKLLKQFCHKLHTAFRKQSLTTMKDAVSKVWLKANLDVLFNKDDFAILRNVIRTDNMFCTSFTELVNNAVAGGTLGEPNQINQFIKIKAEALRDSGFGQLAPSFVSAVNREIRTKSKDLVSDWLVREVIAPLTSKIKAGGLDAKNLFALCTVNQDIHNLSSQLNNNPQRMSEISYNKLLIPASRIRKTPLRNSLGFARNIVILSHRKSDLYDRASKFPIFKHWLGSPVNSMVYIVPNSARKADEARAFFTQLGVQLIDLTVWHSWEEKPVRQAVAAPKPPKRTGLIQLSAVCLKGGYYEPALLLETDDKPLTRLDKPKYVAKVSIAQGASDVGRFSASAAKAVARLWGHETGIATSTPQFDKAISQGAKNLDDHVVETVCAKILGSKKLQKALQLDPSRVATSHYNHQLFKLICEDEPLAKHFKVWPGLTDEERDFLIIWNNNLDRYGMRDIPQVKRVLNTLGKLQPSPALQSLFDLVNHRLARTLEVYHIAPILKTTNPSDQDRKYQTTLRKIIKMITAV